MLLWYISNFYRNISARPLAKHFNRSYYGTREPHSKGAAPP